MATWARGLALLLLAGCDAPPAPSPMEDSISFEVPEELRTPRPLSDQEEVGAITLRNDSLHREFARFERLEWLARHQSADGSWSSFAFGSCCPGVPCADPSRDDETVGVTGLAIAAFLSHGVTHKSRECGSTLRKAMSFLKAVQGPDGSFARPWNSHPGLQNAWAALAVTDMYGVTESKLFQEPAEKAVGYLRSTQLPCGGWCREGTSGLPDLETTVWTVMALRIGDSSITGLDNAAYRRALAWLDGIIDSEIGCAGTDRRLEAETAMAILARASCMSAVGRKRDALFDRGRELVAAHPPAWDSSPGAMDMRAWYFGTSLCYIPGVVLTSRPKVDQQRSNRWADGLSGLQKRLPWSPGTCAQGSLDPCEPWGREHGRVAATAMAAILDAVWF